MVYLQYNSNNQDLWYTRYIIALYIISQDGDYITIVTWGGAPKIIQDSQVGTNKKSNNQDLWYVDISIVNWFNYSYKPTYNWEEPHEHCQKAPFYT